MKSVPTQMVRWIWQLSLGSAWAWVSPLSSWLSGSVYTRRSTAWFHRAGDDHNVTARFHRAGDEQHVAEFLKTFSTVRQPPGIHGVAR